MSQATFQTRNPATGEVLATYSHFSSLEVEARVDLAYKKYHEFKDKPVSERALELRALAAAFRDNAGRLAKTVTMEMGKAIGDAESEIEKCAVACDYFATHLNDFWAPEKVPSAYQQSQIVKDSIGPVLAIMPWNFPVWQALRFAAPAVGIGNPILLKHSDHTAGTAVLIEEIFESVASGLLINLRIDHEQAGSLIGDKRIRGVTLTGSTRAGRQIAETAGRHLKKTVLELGGSDAYLVFADADVKRAGEICAQARMVNNGQSCVAAKRFIVENSVMPEFLQSFEAALRKLKRGDPLDPQTQVGSLAAKKFQRQLLAQCAELEQKGGVKLLDLADSEKFDFNHPGAFFPARVYKAPKDSDFSFQEEFFGPVALLFDFETESEAVALANRSPFGLGGAVFSSDPVRARRVAHLLEAGFVAINEQVKSDARLPFGGVKDSGYGRELSHYGFNEFCNIKTLGIGMSKWSASSAE